MCPPGTADIEWTVCENLVMFFSVLTSGTFKEGFIAWHSGRGCKKPEKIRIRLAEFNNESVSVGGGNSEI